MNIRDILAKQIIIMDGAMGTSIQAAGLKNGEFPESFNFKKPEVIKAIHKEYIEAGCHVITSNSFSANKFKLIGQDFTDEQAISEAIKIAKEAATESGKQIFVAHGIGPSGKMMRPIGDLDFETAYDLYKRQIIAAKNAGADFHLMETFSDIGELKAAIIAAKENSDLPIFCSVTFDTDGRMLTGADPETFIYAFQDMGVDALGVNCSLGPAEIKPILKRMLSVSKIPLLVQPNAGMPREENGIAKYDVAPNQFAEEVLEMIQDGAAIVGGCCGTTPEYMRKVAESIASLNSNSSSNPAQAQTPLGLSASWYAEKIQGSQPSACSPTKSVRFGKETIIMGERINPTGKKKLKQALKDKDYSYLEDEAISQEKSGAHIININVGMEDIDEISAMESAVHFISEAVTAPIQIDSSKPESIENAVRKYRGKPIINSVNGEQASMDKVFPIVEKYGTAVIALTLDEGGIPKTTEDRLKILDKILMEAKKYGITKDRIIVDTLALTVSTDPDSARNTLKAIEAVSNQYKINTVLGASNISFGLPTRDIVNRTFLGMTVYAGITSVITDPGKRDYMDEIKAAEVLAGKDKFAERFIWYNNEVANEQAPKKAKNIAPDLSLMNVILDGHSSKAEIATKVLLQSQRPMEIIDEVIIPALETIGADYESGKTFLPQMIKSAEAVKKTFDVLKPIMAEDGDTAIKGKIVVATVKGDIHDIGKNIVKTILENYGYDVIDLGKDVGTDVIIDTIEENDIKFVGLSALMTTTMVNMKPVVDEIKQRGLNCKVAVGGAVLTQEYSDKINADFYCETAMDTVRAANQVFE